MRACVAHTSISFLFIAGVAFRPLHVALLRTRLSVRLSTTAATLPCPPHRRGGARGPRARRAVARTRRQGQLDSLSSSSSPLSLPAPPLEPPSRSASSRYSPRSLHSPLPPPPRRCCAPPAGLRRAAARGSPAPLPLRPPPAPPSAAPLCTRTLRRREGAPPCVR